MELEHLFQQSGTFTLLQLLFFSSFLVPGIMGGTDIYRAFVRTLTSYVVSFGPMAVLLYVLYAVSRLS